MTNEHTKQGMTVDAVVHRSKFGMTLYLVDPAERGTALWHVTGINDPLSPVDEKEVAWACDRLGADKRATFQAIRQALRAAR